MITNNNILLGDSHYAEKEHAQKKITSDIGCRNGGSYVS